MKIVWHKHNLMISSSVVYGHSVKYSYEILRAASFFEIFRNSHFFSAFFFLFQNSCFFRAKLLPRNHTSRIGNSLAQLPFGTDTYRRYLQKSYFFEADSSAQHQFFQKSKILEKATFSEKQYSALPTLSGELPF